MDKVGHSCNDGLRNTHPIPPTVNKWNRHSGMTILLAVCIGGETNVKQDNAIQVLLER